jgi:cation transport regulator ChaC
VLAGGDDMAEEPPRERLFDVLMRRFEALAPYKEAVRSLMRSARRNPGLAFALNAMAVRSQHWMLEAAGIRASGPKGALRSQGAALMFARVLAVWLDDDPQQNVRALCYMVDRGHRQYAGKLTLDQQVHFVRQGHGRSGNNREYVLAAVKELEAQGIHDEALRLLAERLKGAHDTRAPASV